MTPPRAGAIIPAALRLILVRHGQTPWNAEGRFQGQSDTGLTDLGLQQARCAASALASHDIAAVYSSPLPRALSTAQEIANPHSLGVTPLDGLKEIHLGELEGITGPVMRENYPEVFHTWNNNPSRVSFPGGESLRQLQRRAWRAAQHIESAHPEGTVVAVSHNFAINAIVSRFLGLPLSRFHRIRVDLGSFTVLDIGERYRHLLHFNDRCHLTGLPTGGG